MKVLHHILSLTLMMILWDAGCDASTPQRIWSIGVGAPWGRIEYINEEGLHVGVAPDLIDFVCQEAGMDCRVVRISYVQCWQSQADSKSTGGIGLESHYIDACSTYLMTRDRAHVFGFSLPALKEAPTNLYVLKGRTIDPDNLSGKRIGFMDGYYNDEYCLARVSLDYKPTEDNTKIYQDTKLAVAGLNNGEVDALFNADYWAPELRSQLDKVTTREYLCSLGGAAMMSRKDSAFTANWNVGFTKLKNTNKILTFCEQANSKHAAAGDLVSCLG